MKQKIKIAFVVQRCGKEVNGGAELQCFYIANALKDMFNVEILTTCALDYMTWNNYYPEGIENVEGVPIRRFKVDKTRDVNMFNKYSEIIFSNIKKVNLDDCDRWMKLQGPISSGLFNYLKSHTTAYDYFIFFTYLYASTYYGLPIVNEKSYLVPEAHDEWPIYLPIWDYFFEKPKSFIFNTDEERKFLKKRFPRIEFKGEVVGIGIDTPKDISEERFRKKYNIYNPYILYIGRIDGNKGCGELFDFFIRYKRETSNKLKLVLVGKAFMQTPKNEDIIELGFVDEQTKFDALMGCEFLINPSPYESLSMVILEAWTLNKPTLVTAKSDVLIEQSRRSNSGLWYENYDMFKICLEYLLIKKDIGLNGSKFVKDNYSWELIREKYCKLISN